MRTIRRLLYRDIVTAVAFVAAAFISLMFFIDFVEALADVGQAGHTVVQAALYCLLLVPGHFYEVAPIAVLIGTIYTLSRMAQASEYTILRTGGLGPGLALSLLATLALVFGVLTFLDGDYLAPFSERQASQLRGSFTKSGLKLGRSGAWLKDHVSTPDGERSYSINVGSASSNSSLNNIRIFEFDADGRLLRRVAAASGRVEPNQIWALTDVSVTRWIAGGTAPDAAASAPAQALEEKLARLDWPSTLSAAVVSAAVSPVSTMSTIDLARYIVHLSDNEQAAQRHRIQFWKRALYPFACLVMVALALPFAYMHARGGNVSLKVFGGIMMGISFVLLNNVAGHLGLLQDWTPWVVAAAPSLLYLLLSLAAFGWLVRYR